VHGRHPNHALLKAALDAQYVAFNVEDSATDPVQFVHRANPDPADREIVAFIAAGLAFGRVASVMASVGRVADVLGPRPAAYLRAFDPGREARALAPIVHRWIRGADLVALLLVLQAMLRDHGSLEGAFAAGHDPAAADVGPALDAFAARACAVDVRAAYGRAVPARAGYRYFFARPSAGSACKRLNLFLRWMVRRDAVDPGGWTRVSPSQLVVPLDTHIIRLGRCLGLTRQATPGWKMAAEITAGLRALDPVDPVRYDFALCHLGMMKACRYGVAKTHPGCPLAGWCKPARARGVARPDARGRAAG
jgi:uncharacterized protein (TIGR02757 family)